MNELKDKIRESLKEYFGDTKFLDLSRFQRICDDLNHLSRNMQEMKDNTDLNRQSIRDLFKDNVKVRADIKEGFDNLENKYASKLVEKIVFGGVGVILLTFLGALIYLIGIKHIVYP